jgi:hypothetical protein
VGDARRVDHPLELELEPRRGGAQLIKQADAAAEQDRAGPGAGN